MAALLLFAAGGAAVGAIAGRLAGAIAGNVINYALLGGGKVSQSCKGPRLPDLGVMALTEGAPIVKTLGSTPRGFLLPAPFEGIFYAKSRIRYA